MLGDGLESAKKFGGNETPLIGTFCGTEDSVASFRTCLGRYAYYCTLVGAGFIPQNTQRTFTYKLAIRINDLTPGSIHSYFANCYAGWRGSMTLKGIPKMREAFGTTLDIPSPFPNNFVRTNVRRGLHKTSSTSTEDKFLQDVSVSIEREQIDKAWAGEQVSIPTQGGVTQFKLPYYENKRFSLTDEVSLGFEYEHIVASFRDAGKHIRLSDDLYIAPGEDFNVFFFLGVMPMWKI